MPLYRKILPETTVMPVPFEPTDPTAQGTLIATASGADCYIVDFNDEDEGWYRIQVKAASAGGSRPGTEGYVEHLVYVFPHTRAIIWGASGRETAYPEPTGQFGGYGGFNGKWVRKVS